MPRRWAYSAVIMGVLAAIVSGVAWLAWTQSISEQEDGLASSGPRTCFLGPSPWVTSTISRAERDLLPTPTPMARPRDQAGSPSPRTELLLSGLRLPVALTFAPGDQLYFAEVQAGEVRVASIGGGLAHVAEQPFVKLTVASAPEAGVLGIAVHPSYRENRWIYVYYSEPITDDPARTPQRNRIVRFTEQRGIATNPQLILDNIPMSQTGCHNGGRLAFGPDHKLYVSVGDAEHPPNSQHPSRLNGKVLRLNDDGSIPSDNPSRISPIFASGFRNPYGLAFDFRLGLLLVSDNGSESHDEINLVTSGKNFGYPVYEGYGRDSRFVDPIWSSGDHTLGLTGLTVYHGTRFPQYTGHIFSCSVKGGRLMRFVVRSPQYDRFIAMETISDRCYLDVAEGPDGILYFSSLDAIYRITE